MLVEKETVNLDKFNVEKRVNKREASGVEEAIFKMLKTEGFISESEYTKCIQAFHKH